jgi:hypothetical protein
MGCWTGLKVSEKEDSDREISEIGKRLGFGGGKR